MIIFPISVVANSRSSESCTFFSTSSTTPSSCVTDIGLFSLARRSPERILLRSKASRFPSFFTTMYGISSILSYEVKRRPQPKHSRRRRMESPSFASRESTTLSSIWAQNGHRIGISDSRFKIPDFRFQISNLESGISPQFSILNFPSSFGASDSISSTALSPESRLLKRSILISPRTK